jgi:hypothetical protein
MAGPIFKITQVGLDAASIATPTGPFIEIASYKIGSGYNYTPVVGDTDIHGALLHSGIPSSYSINSSGFIDIVMVMDIDVGPFQFGEIGLYLQSGELFALAAFETLQQKLVAGENQVGSRWKIHGLIKLAESAAIIDVTVENINQLLEIDSYPNVARPLDQLTDANAIIVHDNDDFGAPSFAVRKSDSEWGWERYMRIVSGTVVSNGGNSTTKLYSNDIQKAVQDVSTGKFLVQFLNGAYAGQTRILSAAGDDNVTWTGALGSATTAGMTFEILQSLGSRIETKAITRWAGAGGSANAITATFSPPLITLADGQIVGVRAGAANSSATPTFSPDGLTARTITRIGGVALEPRDIYGSGHEILLRYNLGATRWELLNPTMIGTSSTKWAAGGGSANAITATYDPANLSTPDGLILGVRATGQNTSVSPTFSPDGLTARTITKEGGRPLLAGNIAREGHELLLRYRASDTRWELLNPAPVSVIRGYIDGCITSPSGIDSNAAVYIDSGAAADSTGTYMLEFSGMHKRIDTTWAAGNTAGGTVAGLANQTWYHIFLIRNDSDGSVDACFDTSITAANRPGGYTYYRRIGSYCTEIGSNALRQYVQRGDEFLWSNAHMDDQDGGDTPYQEYLGVPGGANVTVTLAWVPPSISVEARLAVSLFTGSLNRGSGSVYLAGLDYAVPSDSFQSGTIGGFAAGGIGFGVNQMSHVWTNTSRQIGVFGTYGAQSMQVKTLGYKDPRGRTVV